MISETMNKPTVSVVITCFNYGKYLNGCLTSVLSQTFKDIEIIVVNDGSTDNTDDVMKDFEHVANLRYIVQNNAGQANAKNTGIKHAKGEFIAFLDADDLWCDEKLEKQMKCFQNSGVGVVYCRARYLDERNEEFTYEMTSPYLQPRRGSVTRWLVFDNFVQFSSTIVRKECLDRFGVFDESLKMGIDWHLWLRISVAYEFDYVDEWLLFYRMGHSGQMSKNVEERQRCSDRIIADFIQSHVGSVSASLISQTMAYTYCNRGEYYRSTDRWRSTCYYIKALKMAPLNVIAYKGLIKNILYW